LTYPHVYGSRSPKNLTLSHARNSIRDPKAYRIPFTNINAVTVPGAAAGWVDTIEWFGSGRMGLADVLRPAIELAENGFGVSEISAKMVCNFTKRINPSLYTSILDDTEYFKRILFVSYIFIHSTSIHLIFSVARQRT
jgi:gamma-glutamyltranspeptidase